MLVLSLALFNFIDRRDSQPRQAGRAADDQPEKVIGGRSAFALVAGNRYLLGMAMVILILNWVNSASEYILGDRQTGRR